MEQTVLELAHDGQWAPLLSLLRQHPNLVNTASEPKGYTALHQAAWHGAKSAIIGSLLTLGANPTLRTRNKSQTARDVALEKHPNRADLHFLLSDQGRTASQLVRKVAADNGRFFGPYDGNQILCDRLIEALGTDSCCQIEAHPEARVASAFKAVTGAEWLGRQDFLISVGPNFQMHFSPSFWADRFFPDFRNCAAKAQVIPIERHWATIVDLFDPLPAGWGLRGDLFLWLEMSAALNHVPIPDCADEVFSIMAAQFRVMTGASLDSDEAVHVARFKRGGMSGGMVSAEFWRDSLIPLLQQRSAWLHEIWRHS